MYFKIGALVERILKTFYFWLTRSRRKFSKEKLVYTYFTNFKNLLCLTTIIMATGLKFCLIFVWFY